MRNSLPMTAPASRFKKRSFPPEIVGIPTSTVSPRINSTRPLSSIQRPVSAPITPARSQYDELSDSFDNFAEQTSVNITSPFLVAQFLRFSSAFNQFCDTSSMIKNSFFGNYSQRMKIQNSAIIVQARTMMNEWNDFQIFFIKVKSINIIPIYKLISNCFVNLSSAINDCYDLCGVGSRFETIPRSFQKYIDEELKSLNQYSINIFNERVKDFDPVEFYNRTILFIQKTQTKLLTSFFKNRMTTADVMRRKMALSIAYEDLIKNLNATQNFDLLAKEVEDQIILMNQSIGGLYSSLHLPISLRKVKPILDDEGRSLNLSILRPSIDRTTALKESSRRANTIREQLEKIGNKISLKDNKSIKDIENNENDNENENQGDNKNEQDKNSVENESNDSQNKENDTNAEVNETENINTDEDNKKDNQNKENESNDKVNETEKTNDIHNEKEGISKENENENKSNSNAINEGQSFENIELNNDNNSNTNEHQINQNNDNENNSSNYQNKNELENKSDTQSIESNDQNGINDNKIDNQ